MTKKKAITRQEIESTVKNATECVTGMGKDNINLYDKFADDLGCDSLDVFDVILLCEEEFNISVPDDRIDRIVTVADLCDTILSLYKKQEE